MKKVLLVFLLFFIRVSLVSQITIRGEVTTFTNEVLEGASVYLNNTTIGTSTNNLGEFELKIPNGNYDLTVSFIGYKTAQFKIEKDAKVGFLNIKLRVNSNVLEEVNLVKTKYNSRWRRNLSRFKTTFFGRTKLASNCKFLNPKTLHFNYNKKTDVLTATARDPLKIEHKGLGYLITYDLVDFKLERERISYLGYTKYQKLKGSKRDQKKWKANRLEAFNGSRMHFVRSLRNKTLKQEGFVVNQFMRVENKERPSEKEIEIARKIVKFNGSVNPKNKVFNPRISYSKALSILRKASLPKEKDILYKRNVPYRDMIENFEQTIYLKFKDYLSIVYLHEKEEKNYRGATFTIKSKHNAQTSSMILLTDKSILDSSGVIINPLDVMVEGYWGFEQFANTLPLDYQPPKE